MSRIRVGPPDVAKAHVRRLSGDGRASRTRVRRLAVPVVPAARVVPRQLDPVALRLMALQRENDQLRAALDELRTTG